MLPLEDGSSRGVRPANLGSHRLFLAKGEREMTLVKVTVSHGSSAVVMVWLVHPWAEA